MDALRKLVNPGKDRDDEIMYSSGANTDPAHQSAGLTGEGGHLESHNKNTTATDPALQSSTTGATGNTAGNTVGGNTASNTRTAYGTEGGNFTSGTGSVAASNNPYSAQEVDPRLGATQHRMAGSFPEDDYPTGSNTLGTNTAATNTAGGYNAGSNTGVSGNTGGREFPLRDTAAVGGAAAAGEGVHHHHERERERQGLGNTAGAQGYGSNVESQRIGNTDHRFGNDPATTGPTAGVAETRHHHGSAPQGGAFDGSATTGYGSQTGHETVGNTDHRYGRDAAAVGAAAAAGAGVHHHNQNQRERELEREGLGNTSNTGYQGTTATGSNQNYYGAPSGTAVPSGPHSTRTANVLDPGVNTQTRAVEDARVHHPEVGGGAEAADKHHGVQPKHLGRDAAVGGAGIGLAEHEHRKHEGVTGRHDPNVTGASTTGPGATTTAGTGSGSHHLGRDAAVGGAGVGLAEHEHRKHEGLTGNRDPNLTGTTGIGPTTAGTTGTGPSTTTTAGTGSGQHHLARDAAVGGAGVGLAEHEHRKHEGTTGTHGTGHGLGERDARSGAAVTGQSGAGYNEPLAAQDKKHHTGRDVAGAGAVGVGAYETDKHHENKKEERREEKAARQEQKAEHKEAKHEAKEEKKHHGLFGFLKRDKNKKYTKEEEEEFDRQERQERDRQGQSHFGRDAALGGAAGAGAYEAEKHHQHHHGAGTADTDVNKPLPTAPGNNGVGTGAGTGNALADRTRGTGTGTGAGVGTTAAAAGGAAALGEHEHHKHQAGVPPEVDQAPGNTLGDKLHGVERNRGINTAEGYGEQPVGVYGESAGGAGAGAGVPGTAPGATRQTGAYDTTTGQTGSHHLGRDAALGAGAAGLAEHEHRKHEGTRGAGEQLTTGAPTGTTGAYQTTGTTGTGHTSGTSHLGRDAALGAGAGGLAEHEHRKHEATRDARDTATTSGTTGSSHLGRDAALGAGAGGLAGHEYRKAEAHEPTHGAGPTETYGTPIYDQFATTGRDTDLAAGAGLSGAGAATGAGVGSGLTGHRKTDSGVGIGGAGEQEYGGQGQYETGAGKHHHGPQVAHHEPGLNKLHKNPPASHPAAQGGVTDDGTRIEPGTGRPL